MGRNIPFILMEYVTFGNISLTANIGLSVNVECGLGQHFGPDITDSFSGEFIKCELSV